MGEETVTYKWSYGANDYEISVDLAKSPYYKKIPSVMDPSLLPYYSTIDDPVSVEFAQQLNTQTEGRRDYIKICILLAFVQNTVEYVSDEERFGTDVWETPIYVLRECMADCDGMASLFTSIAHNMGLDVVSVIIPGHMFSAVHAHGCHGAKYDYMGKPYYHVETTDRLPAIGRFWGGNPHTLYIEKPAPPNKAYLDSLRRYVR